MKGILFSSEIWIAKREVLERYGIAVTRRVDGTKEINQPRYHIGEVVYIKEGYSHYGDELNCGVWTALIEYKVDGSLSRIPFGEQIPPREKWWNTGKSVRYYQTPLFMPAWAARFFIKILDVRPELLTLPLSAEELALEGGEITLPLLTSYNHKWVNRYQFETRRMNEG